MTIDINIIQKVKQTVAEILDKMDITADISTRATEELIFVNIENPLPSAEKLIGWQGNTLLALQLIVSVMINQNLDRNFRIILDVDNYRQKREKYLTDLAKKIAQKVIHEQNEVSLDPMHAFERRIIHMTLQDHPDIQSTSRGRGRNRHVVVSPLRKEK